MNNKSTLWKMPSIQRKFTGEIKTGACHSCLGFSKPVSTSDSMKQFCPSGHPGGSFCIKKYFDQGPQSFTSFMADLRQDINRVS